MATTVTGTTSTSTQTDQQHVWQRLTMHLRHALFIAERAAIDAPARSIDPIHLLYGLSLEGGSIAYETLKGAGITSEAIRHLEEEMASSITTQGQETRRPKSPPSSPSVKTYLLHAAQRARALGHAHIGTEHLLIELLEHEPEILRRLVDTSRYLAARKHILSYLEGSRKLSEAASSVQLSLFNDASVNQQAILQMIGTDLTDLARQGRLDPVEGRDEDIHTCLSILARKTKNTPLLVGPAGVGKTAIVEGIAHRIVADRVPACFRNRRLLSLDLASLVAGTGYRGEFEQRMRQLIDELRADPSVIVFIDEFHTIVGTGNTPNGLDVANLLKPALARGQIALIGATTPDEYREVIEKDAALERRVQPVFVRETTHEETRTILGSVRTRLETFHSIAIDDSLLDVTIALCERYLPERQFPDKAIDVLDQACGSVVTRIGTDQSLPVAPTTSSTRAHDMEKLEADLEKAITSEQYDIASEIDRQIKFLSSRIAREKEASRLKDATRGHATRAPLTSQDLRDTVARMIGVHPTHVTVLSDPVHIHGLTDQIKTRVFGQDHVIDAILPLLARAGVGLTQRRHPLASFLFVGPSGSGKTHMAETIASSFFSNSDSLLRLDMSEFSERFTVSRLIGAPAGYIGYNEGGKLTEYVRRHPFGVILFDEIDKAHPEILNLLLQILDVATLTDSAGRTVSFRHCIIILTANLRSGQGQKSTIGYDHAPSTISRSDLEKEFRPELLNRLDHIAIFTPLGDEALHSIAQSVISERLTSWKNAGIDVRIDSSLIPMLTVRPPHAAFGARSIERSVTHLLEPHILSALLHGKKQIHLRQRNGKITASSSSRP